MQKTFTLDELPVVARTADTATRRALAGSSAIPAKILEIFVDDPDAVTRLRVTRNPKTSGRLLGQLARDEEPQIRAEVAVSHKTPIDALVRLAHDADPTVRRAVAANWHRTPRVVLAQLAETDSDAQVRTRAQDALPWAKTPMPKGYSVLSLPIAQEPERSD